VEKNMILTKREQMIIDWLNHELIGVKKYIFCDSEQYPMPHTVIENVINAIKDGEHMDYAKKRK
jgi:hypothetical protein